MINAKRLFGYLATGAMPEMTALDAALARHALLVAAMDAIDFEAHDKRYHGGHFDPKRMRCEMREALEYGDLVDVLKAERQEDLTWQRERHKERIRNRERDEMRRLRNLRRIEALQRTVVANPEQMTDEEFKAYYCRPNVQGQERIQMLIRSRFKLSSNGENGTHLGDVSGMPVYPHSRMDQEMARSKNMAWLKFNDPETYAEKVFLIRDLRNVLKTVSVNGIEHHGHKSNNFVKWQCEKGFAWAPFTHKGKSWYFVFGVTDDDRLMLYDIVQKEKGQLRT